MLAMSLASWAHSPKPSQTHWDPLGHREVKLSAAAAPKALHARAPSLGVFCRRQSTKKKKRSISKNHTFTSLQCTGISFVSCYITFTQEGKSF